MSWSAQSPPRDWEAFPGGTDWDLRVWPSFVEASERRPAGGKLAVVQHDVATVAGGAANAGSGLRRRVPAGDWVAEFGMDVHGKLIPWIGLGRQKDSDGSYKFLEVTWNNGQVYAYMRVVTAAGAWSYGSQLLGATVSARTPYQGPQAMYVGKLGGDVFFGVCEPGLAGAPENLGQGLFEVVAEVTYLANVVGYNDGESLCWGANLAGAHTDSATAVLRHFRMVRP